MTGSAHDAGAGGNGQHQGRRGRAALAAAEARVAGVLRRVRGPGATEHAQLVARVGQLEVEVEEQARLNLRLAELADVVQELLVPIADRDEERVRAVLEQYTTELGS